MSNDEATNGHSAQSETPTTSEAAAMADIVLWSQACPHWQRDALRRLCLHEKLSADDLAALTLLSKGSNADAFEPASAEHVRDGSAEATVVTLKSIHGVQHVNALAAGESLTFDKSGITVAYGDNGSGKSGYARILKRACRARLSRGDTILPNIYGISEGVPNAAIDFAINGQNKSSKWSLSKVSDPLLSAVSVFDSRTANVHVEQTNDVAYTPLPLKILGGLAQACQDVKQQLNGEIKTLEQMTPAVIAKPSCQPGTRVGKLIAGISTATPELVEELACLTEADKARLAHLKSDLAADPARTVRQLQGLKTKLDAQIAALDKLTLTIGDSNIAALRGLFKTLSLARSAAQAASDTLFAKEPLPEIGSETWRALWEAARSYSERSAYSGKPFPVTEEAARCVLCHQELSERAADRLNRFEKFVKDESKRRESEAQIAYTDAVQSLEQSTIAESDWQALVAMIESDIGDAALAAEISAALSGALRRLKYIKDHHQEESFAAPLFPLLPIARLRHVSADVLARTMALSAEASSSERKRLVDERDDLADREWFSGIKADVIAEIGRRRDIAALQKALRDTTTNKITAKSAEVAETLVTNALRAQFAKEVDKLGVAGLAIELRQEKTAQGVPFFRVTLIKKPAAPVGEVLSEGEHRCVALAAFLAETATTDSRSALVFDDPVSSLDHMHREAVAKRLAEEGTHRQVIVFTHDLAFLFLLNEACRDKGTHIGFRSINRGADFSGFCQTNPPPNAQPVEKVIEGMSTYLSDRKIHFERGNRSEWYLTVRSLQEQLRTTWERAVEEALSPVIKRLANKVDTKGLFKITVLTAEDCNVMRNAFGRCSALLHSEAEVLNKPLPNPKIIQDEIDALTAWFTDIRDRQAKIQASETVTQRA